LPPINFLKVHHHTRAFPVAPNDPPAPCLLVLSDARSNVINTSLAVSALFIIKFMLLVGYFLVGLVAGLPVPAGAAEIAQGNQKIWQQF